MIDPLLQTMAALALGVGSAIGARQVLAQLGRSLGISPFTRAPQAPGPKWRQWPSQGQVRGHQFSAEFQLRRSLWRRRVIALKFSLRSDTAGMGFWRASDLISSDTKSAVIGLLVEGRQVEVHFRPEALNEEQTPTELLSICEQHVQRWREVSGNRPQNIAPVWLKVLRVFLFYPENIRKFLGGAIAVCTLFLLGSVHARLHLLALNLPVILGSAALPAVAATIFTRRALAPAKLLMLATGTAMIPLALATAFWLNTSMDFSERELVTLPVESISAGITSTKREPIGSILTHYRGLGLRLELSNSADLARIQPGRTQVQLLVRRGAFGVNWLESWLLIWHE